jgi:4-amino-4-deoxy-L-arabinose transferase-like glycosyltransferase
VERQSAAVVGRPEGFRSTTLERWLWGDSATIFSLLAVASVVLLARLGAAELWTMEGRWAGICAHMIDSGDYFHPYLFGDPYYDKPLLSYWLMIGAARVLGRLNEAALRLPSVLAGLLSLWCLYRLGKARFDRATGLTATALLASTYMFVFWSRVASADMLNVAGTLAAVTWYFERREHPGFVTAAVFFALLAATALMKGLVGPAIAVLVLLPDVAREGRWRAVLRPYLVPALLCGAAVYFAPFLVSSATRPQGYGESGLAMVFQENVARYFDPFDHEEPFYIYLGVLPVYLLPWTIFLPFVLLSLVRRWRSATAASRWPALACLLILILLTGSGSRRAYYLLPIVPFAALMIAEWLRNEEAAARWATLSAWGVVGALAGMLVWFAIIVPTGFRYGGQRLLAREVRAQAEKEAPWSEWHVLICGAPPSSGYYFRAGYEAKVIPAADADELEHLVAENPRTIVLTKRRFVEAVQAQLPGAMLFVERSRLPRFLRSRHGSERDIIALVP